MKFGVVGVGHLGSLHAKMLGSIEDVTLVGVFDLDTQKAEKVASQCKTKSYDSLDRLIEDVDAITIATTTTDHHKVATKALSAGNHVFIEKPITSTVEEADALIDLAKQKDLLIQVGHIERFNSAILAVEKYDLQPMFVESHRLAQFNPRGTDVAVVLDLMIHDIDLILSFVQSPVSRIDANGVAVVSDTVDIANARIQFENGCVANVTASRISQKKMRKMRLFQRNGYISIDFSEKHSEVFRLVGDGEPRERGTLKLGEIGSGSQRRTIVYEKPKVKEVNALQYELALFVNAIQTKTPPPVTAEEGRRALEVANIIMQRIGEQTVRL